VIVLAVTSGLLANFTLVLAIAAGLGAAALLLRQPTIVAFIAVGIVVGPTGLNLLEDVDVWDLLASMGISVLLFVVGLRLDLSEIRSTGPVALITGLGQVAFTSVIGWLIALALGLSAVAALYVAVALTFSSTIIIVKLLSDKREVDSLHGRIAVGFLIVQDVVVVLALIGLSAIGGAGGDAHPLQEAALALLKGAGLVAGVGLAAWLVMPHAARLVARSPELLVLSAVAWAMGLAYAADWLDFSMEVGAFLAGISLASTPYRDAIAARLVALRDFLLLFFFVTLGASLDLSGLGDQVPSAVVFSVFVLVGNPLIVMVIMGAMGYRKRTGFLCGLTVAQISEFSLILAALGVSLGHISDDTLSLVTLVGIITIGTSTYLIIYSHQVYDRLDRWLSIFERAVPHRENAAEQAAPDSIDALVFGLGRYGGEIARQLRDLGLSVEGIDFDPEAVRAWAAAGLNTHYGDAEDPELPGSLPLERTACVVATFPATSTTIYLVDALRRHGYRGRIVAAARAEQDAGRLEHAGAHLVLRPFSEAAERAAAEIAACLGRMQPEPAARPAQA
jgi:Kef-type K+ transport system membrane component KefB